MEKRRIKLTYLKLIPHSFSMYTRICLVVHPFAAKAQTKSFRICFNDRDIFSTNSLCSVLIGPRVNECVRTRVSARASKRNTNGPLTVAYARERERANANVNAQMSLSASVALDIALDIALETALETALDIALDIALETALQTALDIALETALHIALGIARDRSQDMAVCTLTLVL